MARGKYPIILFDHHTFLSRANNLIYRLARWVNSYDRRFSTENHILITVEASIEILSSTDVFPSSWKQFELEKLWVGKINEKIFIIERNKK